VKCGTKHWRAGRRDIFCTRFFWVCFSYVWGVPSGYFPTRVVCAEIRLFICLAIVQVPVNFVERRLQEKRQLPETDQEVRLGFFNLRHGHRLLIAKVTAEKDTALARV